MAIIGALPNFQVRCEMEVFHLAPVCEMESFHLAPLRPISCFRFTRPSPRSSVATPTPPARPRAGMVLCHAIFHRDALSALDSHVARARTMLYTHGPLTVAVLSQLFVAFTVGGLYFHHVVDAEDICVAEDRVGIHKY